jgi:pyridoxal phosphate enzyme (YggS family)
MLTGPQILPANVAQLRTRIERATALSGRPAGSVTLIAVSKDQPLPLLTAARQAGVTDFGENYLQEALAKLAALPRQGVTWHFIGQLQSNKTRPVAEHFDWVHTVDRERTAARLAAQRPESLAPLQVCLQVLIEPEPGKGGASPEALAPLAQALAQLPRLRLRGLMCVPPPGASAALSRARFARVRALKDELNAAGHALDVLSIGMSDDFESAILEGATHVRIGTALFGSRARTPPA